MKWQNTEQYEWLQALSAHGLAWEFLRRNRAYRSAAANLGVTWPPDGSPPDETWSAGDQMSEAREWGLLLFETPDRDAREANIFWMPEFCPSVLPVIASREVGSVSGRFLNLSRLRCRNVLIPGEDIQHLLCADQGRFLQLSVTGECLTRPVQVLANVLPMTPYSETRWRGFRRLNDLVCTETLRTKFYPPDLGARRLSRVLQALATLLGVGTELGFGSEESDLLRAIRQSTQQNVSQAGQRLTEKNLNIQPTIRVRPGWSIRVIVQKDLILRAYRG